MDGDGDGERGHGRGDMGHGTWETKDGNISKGGAKLKLYYLSFFLFDSRTVCMYVQFALFL